MKTESETLLTHNDGATRRTVELSLRQDGSIEFNTCDSGEAPKAAFGHEDYEWWVKISSENVARLAFALLKEKYEGKFHATDDAAEFCKQVGIDYDWSSYP